MKTILNILNHALPLRQHFDIRVTNEPWMTLTIEGIGKGPRSLPAISVTHYGEQNGDLMRDPEMCFELEIEEGKIVDLAPYYYRNDYTGIEQQSVITDGVDSGLNPVCGINARMLEGQRDFARVWDENLAAQGFQAAFLKSLQGAGK